MKYLLLGIILSLSGLALAITSISTLGPPPITTTSTTTEGQTGPTNTSTLITTHLLPPQAVQLPPTASTTTTTTTAPTTTITTVVPSATAATTTPTTTVPTVPPVSVIPTVPTTPPVGNSEVPENPVDSEMLDRTNKERVTNLAWSAELAAYAKVHLKMMMRAGNLYHSEIGRLLTHWKVVGENVGRGATVDAIQKAYMASPSHAENVTRGVYTHFGSASETDSAGIIWTCEIFGAK